MFRVEEMTPTKSCIFLLVQDQVHHLFLKDQSLSFWCSSLYWGGEDDFFIQ